MQDDHIRTISSCMVMLTVLILAGCSSPKPTTSVKPVASPSTAATPGIAAVISHPNYSLTDPKGQPVAKISAQLGAVLPTSGATALGKLTKGSATLFQKGKAIATMTADTMQADNATRVLTASGNVLVRSRNNKDGVSNSVRSDTMRWKYDTDTVTGKGNVIVSRGDLITIPGNSFTADTGVQHYTIDSDGTLPATGNY